MKDTNGVALLEAGGSVFTLTLANKLQLSSTDMKDSKPQLVTLDAAYSMVVPVAGTYHLRSSFGDQRALPGICGVAIDVDTPISISLEPLEIIAMEDTPAKP